MALSPTTLVNVDADMALKLAEFIGSKLSAPEEFVSECQKSIDACQALELVGRFLDKHELLLDLENDEDVDGAFQALFSTMYLVGENHQEAPFVKLIVSTLTGNTTHAVKRRLNALISLLNLCSEPSSKVEVWTAILNYSMATSLNTAVAHNFYRIKDWSSQWGLSAVQQRAMLALVASMLAQIGQHAESLQMTIQYLHTFQGQALDAEAQSALVKALLEALRSPLDAFDDRVALCEATSTLNVTGEAAKLAALLKILCNGSLEEFDAFRASNGALFSSHSLSAEDLEHKLRVLTLCSLAAQNCPKRELSFAALSAALKVDIAEVELWVVEAVASGLLVASIDQLQSTVTVNRFAYRSFGANDWKAVQKGLRELSQQISTATAHIHERNA